jgi:hypothetical protein
VIRWNEVDVRDTQTVQIHVAEPDAAADLAPSQSQGDLTQRP